MIPATGWSDDTQLTEYATYGITKHQHSSDNPFELELGPEQLNTSGGNIKAAWWLFEFTGSEVIASKYNGNSFEPSSVVFSVTNIRRLSATFDQLGRPMVFYETNSNELKLFWFDPVLVQNIITEFGVGNYPFATFDIRWDTSNPRSDVMLFYMRTGAIYYRMQRDRYEIEYSTPVTADAVFIKEADMAVDYRLQLLYRYRDTGFTPPEPTPPIVAPDTGYFAYLLTGYQSAVEIAQAGAISANQPFSIAFTLDNVGAINSKSTLFSYGNKLQMAKVSLCFSGPLRDIMELSYFGYLFQRKIAFGLQDGDWLIEFYRLSGTGQNDSMRLSCKPKGSDTYQVYHIDGAIKPTNTAKGEVFRLGSRPSYGERVYNAPGDTGSGFVPDNEYAFGLRGAISNIELHTAIEGAPVIKLPMVKAQNEEQTLFDAMGSPLPLPTARINDYKSANWQFVKL